MTPEGDGPTRDELMERAREADIHGRSNMSNEELEQALQAKQTAAAGPIVPEGETEPQAPASTGKKVTGVQPQDEDDIPEAGR
jgi:hypothetical protein